MVVRFIDSVLCYFVLFLFVFGIIAGNIGANRNVILKTRKKYVVPSEASMNEQILAEGNALKERVDREYVLTNRDGIPLHGYLIRPAERSGDGPDPAADGPERFIFFSHSYHSRLGGFEFARTVPIWLSRGYTVFLIDHRAHGKSGGKFTSFGQHESDDCIEWLQFLRKEFGEDIRVAMIGQSMGAATVLLTAGKETLPENVRCVISDSGYTNFYSTLWNLLPLQKWLRSPTLWPMDRYLDIVHQIRMNDSDALGGVKKARVPILFLQGAKDSFVPLWMNEELYDACVSEKERVVFPNATHIKSYAYDPERYERVVTEFVKKYMS